MEQERRELEEALGDVLDAAVGHPAREERVGLRADDEREGQRPYRRKAPAAAEAAEERGVPISLGDTDVGELLAEMFVAPGAGPEGRSRQSKEPPSPRKA